MPSRRKLGVEEVLRLVRISSPRISPSGDIAFSTTVPDLESNKYRNEIRVLWSSGEQSFYQGEGDSQPEWSPDSRLLAFASRRTAGKGEKGSGLYVAGRLGEARRIAWFKHGISSLAWLDARRMLVVAPVEEKDFYDGDGDYVMTNRLPLWFDGAGFIAGLSDQLHLVDADSGFVEKITEEKIGVASAESCRGYIYYVSLESWKDPLTTHLKRIKPEGGEPETILEGLTISSIKCVGQELYLLAHKREIGIASHNKLYKLQGGGAECLSCDSLDRNIWSIAGGLDGRPAVVYADSGRSVLAVIDEKGVEDLVRMDSVIYEAHSNGVDTVFTASNPVSPTEVYRLSGGRVLQVTSINSWLGEKFKLYKPIHISLNSQGDQIDGWFIEPDDTEGPKPLILFVHGGPKGMYGYSFHYEMQLFASQGFIVAYSNPRGSDGYSEEFADIRGKYGEVDFNQIMDFLSEVLARVDADQSRLVVTGISYGGYMTNVIITKTSKFSAAVSENGIADWIADFWAADIGYWFDVDQIGGTPLDNLEEYVKRSPVFNAEKVKTPLLIIHSMQDYRCFIDQALAMHTALKILGKDSTLLVFTRGSHSHSILSSPRHRRKRLETKLKWIKEKLGLDKAR
ncbi:MAG: S9 family peptidase [Aeropyrum sp.]|nr:S9 family peptidase [Aeropyrum sp.]